MKRVSKPLRIFLIAFGIFVLFGITQFLDVKLSNPIDSAKERAAELGWPRERADLMGAGYGTRFMSRYTYVKLREREEPHREVYVHLERGMFGSWQLTEFRVGDREFDPKALAASEG